MYPNILITHNWAHRLLTNGIIESAPVKATTLSITIDNSQWQNRGGSSMDMNGADLSEVQSQLQRLNAIFYDNHVRVPKSEEPVPQ